jgi:hypothetical protein
VKERLSGPKALRRAADVLAATYVLLGLRYSDEFARTLYQEVIGMEESATYQGIVRRTKLAELRNVLLLQGNEKFGPPDDETRAALERIAEVEELEKLAVRFVNAGSWQELLPPPPRARRRNAR